MKTIAVLFYIISTVSAFAQNESGERIPFNFKNKKSIYSFFNRTFPIIRNIPPINEYTPNEIFSSFNFFNLLLKKRIFLPHQNLSYSSNRINYSDEDLVRYAWKCLYLIDDYDPVKSNQFYIETKINTNQNYYFDLEYFRRKLCDCALDLPNRKKRKIYSLLQAHYILKVVITSSQKTPDVNGEIYDRYNFYCTLIDTLKGKIHEENLLNYPTDLDDKLYVNKNSFSFLSSVFTSGICLYAGPHLYKSSESKYSTRSDGYIYFNHGDTAIVFLSYYDDFYSTNKVDNFTLAINNLASNGVLPVINGIVKDINNVWSNQLYLPYEEWKEEFEKSKRFILDFEL